MKLLYSLLLVGCSSATPWGEKDCRALAGCLGIPDVTYADGACRLATPHGTFTFHREVIPASLVTCQLAADQCKEALKQCKE